MGQDSKIQWSGEVTGGCVKKVERSNMTESETIVESPCFSLMCSECDAGGEFETQADAEAAGWTAIHDDDGPSWNQLGLCPECELNSALEGIENIVRGIRNANDPDEEKCNVRWPEIAESHRRPACIRDDMERATETLSIAAAHVAMLREWQNRDQPT